MHIRILTPLTDQPCYCTIVPSTVSADSCSEFGALLASCGTRKPNYIPVCRGRNAMFGLTPREMALTFGALVLGAIITLLGYFGKRWIEGTSIDAKLARRTKVLELDAKLKERGMTDADLDKLEGDLVGRRKSQHQAEDQVAAEVAQQRILLGGPRPGETQAEMNRLAAADLDTANAMLARALLELEMHGEHTRLKAAQAAWDAYAVAEAEYRSALFLGGTAYPTIYLSELEQLTVSRIAALRAYTDWRKTL